MRERVFFVGDPHNQWEMIVPVLLEHKPIAAVLLGDMELVRPLHEEMKAVLEAGIEVYWIAGNHDGDEPGMLRFLFDCDLADNNLTGKVRRIGGLDVAGIGGVFRQSVWNPKVDPKPRHLDRNSLRRSHRAASREQVTNGLVRDGIPFHQHVAIWPDDYARLKRQRADILVLHEAPECHPDGYRALGELAEAMKVSKVIHGHHHKNYRGVSERGVPVIGVSLAGIIDQDGTLIAGGLTGYRATRGHR